MNMIYEPMIYEHVATSKHRLTSFKKDPQHILQSLYIMVYLD